MTIFDIIRNADTAEVRRGDDGALDELVARNASVFLEQLDKGHWFLLVEVGGFSYRVDLHSKKRIEAVVSVEAS